MSPIGVTKYLIYSGFFIAFLVLGFRLLFMDAIAIEETRQRYKRRFHMSRDTFNSIRKKVGFLSLLISLVAFWFIISDFVSE